ncbi:PepSY domain-containing protein [Chitinophaga sp. SYP-B3965]|uniref:PepSY-associated TM helix domain-containing protein n=1 Tax=Chitinophaga sp. SYP-B3965 TaxID=2663120 RepID=UPI0012997837|nr:PepSY-associated TM helix domain-containing protein [Chitinophaga sp. SYP-B3965]MRG47345.1 PepSY domain-containing protein [Chitinophaga sp. SYP-B3965]
MQQSTQKKKGKSTWRRINNWLHLWLGLSSGLIVFIVSVTGCLYAFKDELSDLTQPYKFVTAEAKPYLTPSQLKAIAGKEAFGAGRDTGINKITGVSYGSPKTAAIASFVDKKDGFTMIYINPYNGTILKKKALKHDFFRFVLEGHFQLWMPRNIGQPIVATGVLIFVVLLITGLIMWWPKKWSKANRNKSFKIKTDAGPKRINYDLHNVLGFYAMVFALVIAMTGLVYGFQWFSKSYYYTLTGGKSLPKFQKGVSDTLLAKSAVLVSPEDKAWANLQKEYPEQTGTIQIQFAYLPTDAIGAVYNPGEGTFYKRQFRYFDKYSLAEIKGGGIYAKTFANASTGEKIYRMNYDIHVGAVLGLTGKFIAFFASLICASLPITGFYIWWGKRKKKSAKRIKPATRRLPRVAASL